ncbi:neuropeptide S [Phascolarctos cinereus]|uniref:Neuropeptide S n=1 Tax=Phascolarctos cinereus TaxID=38626 RepID=A0A6P5J4L7_PHACI|nr:neuropeptide S [Phascolarctos cinereus]
MVLAGGDSLDVFFFLCSSLKLNLFLVLWISSMQMLCCNPTPSPTLSEKSDYFLILLNSCLAAVDRSEELAFLKPFFVKNVMKRSFRNGVGTGIKKTSFRRAKS